MKVTELGLRREIKAKTIDFEDNTILLNCPDGIDRQYVVEEVQVKLVKPEHITNSTEYMRTLDLETKLAMVQKTFGYDKTLDYRPYCMCCRNSSKMRAEDYGYRCLVCGNIIGFNAIRLIESPLNSKDFLEMMKQRGIVYDGIK